MGAGHVRLRLRWQAAAGSGAAGAVIRRAMTEELGVTVGEEEEEEGEVKERRGR